MAKITHRGSWIQVSSLNKEDYLEAIKRLDASSKDASLPKQLQHYLLRRSYHKAKDLLDASDF